MKVGVVGKPNVGKSTLFKAETLAPVEIANYPFVTIKANKGFGHVLVPCPGKQFSKQCQPKHGFCIKDKRFIPVELIDVAGLVPGAHEGKGLGNEFLNDLREADALIHVVDVAGTTNEKGEPTQNYDPANDIEFLETELDMWIFGIIKRGWERFATKVKHEHMEMDKSLLDQLSGLKINIDQIQETLQETDTKSTDITEWTDDTLRQIATKVREKSKPMIIAANKIDLPGAKANLAALRKKFPDKLIVGCSAECELALREAAHHELIEYVPGEDNFKILKPDKISDKQRKALEFIKANVLAKNGDTGVQEVLNQVVFKLLNHIAVFPVANSHLQDKDGNVLPDCFLVPEGTTAHEFAYKVHTDIGKNFVKAVSMVTMQAIGKDHPVKHCDVVEIMT